MKRPTFFHWSKDFVEHLRAVHFTLALVSLVLIIACTNGLDSKLPLALTQIQQIAKFEKEWSMVPARLYQQALENNSLETSWANPVAIVLPPDFYPKRVIATWTKVPAEEVLKVSPWKFEGKAPPAELSTLADFRDFWNDLHKGMKLRLAKMPSADSQCSQFVRVTNTDGSVDIESQSDSPQNSFSAAMEQALSKFHEEPAECQIRCRSYEHAGRPEV